MIKLKFESDPLVVHIALSDFDDSTLCGESIGIDKDAIIVNKKPTCETCIIKHQENGKK